MPLSALNEFLDPHPDVTYLNDRESVRSYIDRARLEQEGADGAFGPDDVTARRRRVHAPNRPPTVFDIDVKMFVCWNKPPYVDKDKSLSFFIFEITVTTCRDNDSPGAARDPLRPGAVTQLRALLIDLSFKTREGAQPNVTLVLLFFRFVYASKTKTFKT
ncbi:hypothetical protein EVAR_92743_1 [Eumeta japonica]|uniref:Uncharacterized protein n=1 Tax=Eumeta variegata TaxID=151549 RepID=A0A4C1SZX9_EUMVA|nr:hypothetical protein EVAR_92743_1 [Eumeta japonica]